jgi:protein phosphatase PTC7
MNRFNKLVAAPIALYVQQKLTTEKAEAKAKPNWLESAHANIPHWEKAHRGGEDAWICTDSLIAVADGVGGWNKKGIDPGIFARELCRRVLSTYEGRTQRRFEVDMWELLVQNVKRTEAPGSSTFVMALMDEEDTLLRTLNLGDSAVMIVRTNAEGKLEIKFRSEEK